MNLIIIDIDGYKSEYFDVKFIPRVGEKIWHKNKYFVRVNAVAYNYFENVVTVTVEW